MTAPATGTAPAAPGSTEPPEAPVTPAAEPATGPADGDLGDAGKAAIQKERDARKAADKARREAEAALQQLQDAHKTDEQRNADRMAQLEQDAAKALHYEAAERVGLPLAMAMRLNGSTIDELVADGEQFKQLLGSAAPTPPAPPAPKPDPRQGGGQAETGGSMESGRAAYQARKNRN